MKVIDRTWWRLFQKRVVRTNFDIYVYILVHAIVVLAPYIIKLFGFSIFRHLAYLMKVIPETRRVHQIGYLRFLYRIPVYPQLVTRS